MPKSFRGSCEFPRCKADPHLFPPPQAGEDEGGGPLRLQRELLFGCGSAALCLTRGTEVFDNLFGRVFAGVDAIGDADAVIGAACERKAGQWFERRLDTLN